MIVPVKLFYHVIANLDISSSLLNNDPLWLKMFSKNTLQRPILRQSAKFAMGWKRIYLPADCPPQTDKDGVTLDPVDSWGSFRLDCSGHTVNRKSKMTLQTNWYCAHVLKLRQNFIVRQLFFPLILYVIKLDLLV